MVSLTFGKQPKYSSILRKFTANAHGFERQSASNHLWYFNTIFVVEFSQQVRSLLLVNHTVQVRRSLI
jgi:hypothetical protein